MTADLEDVVDVRTLTPTQQGMLYHSLAEPDADVFHSQVVVTLPADLDVAALRAAWDVLVDRHETLRSAFFWDGLDDPLQVVRPAAALPWRVEDWRERSPADVDTALAALLERDRFAPFALDEAPLVRMLLVRRPDERWTWVWTFHHLLLDGWSVRVLTRELEEVLQGRAAALAPPVPPQRHAAWLASRDPAVARRHWTETLRDVPRAQRIELPGLAPDGTGHDRRDVVVPPELVARLRATTTGRRTTLGTAVTAAWSLVVSSITSSPRPVVGLTTSGRPPTLPGVEDLVGLFLTTLPLVTEATTGMTTGDHLDAVHRAQLDLVAHQDLGLVDVHRLAGVRGTDRLFESIVVIENLPPERTAGGTGVFDELEFLERSDFPLALLATPGDPFTLRLVFDRRRFGSAAAAVLLDATVRALDHLAAPDRDLAALDLTTSPSEVTGPPLPAPQRTVVDDVAALARTHGDAPAVATTTTTVTYADLWARVEQLAGRLAGAGVGAGAVVGVLVPRSVDAIVAMLGVLRAGAAYVPLDPGYPAAHLRVLAAAAGVTTLVTTTAVTERPDADRVVLLDADEPQPGAAPPPPPGLDDVAYVIHTSGSSGPPKGVVVTHRNLAASTAARSVHYDEPPASFLLLSSTSFDSSVVGIYWTLTTGGCLVLPDPGGEHDPRHLGALIEQHDVTHLLALPGLHRVVAEELGTLPASLRCVIVAGEAIDTDVVAAHRRATDARLHNEYGPTEATVWATVADVDVHHGDVTSIGRPIPGTRVRVVDHLGRPVPVGAPGELLLAGPGLARGYLDDATATAAAFPQHDGRRWYRTGDRCALRPSGDLVFLGRVDDQVKVRGHRIEPGAVAAALREVDGVADAAVRTMVVDGRTLLVGHVEGAVDPAEVRRALAARLPRHLVPDHLEVLDALPRLPNGKLDAAALPVPRRVRPAAPVPPSTSTEQVLATIWQDLLGVDDVGVDEDFFDLGGDSLLAIRMISHARRAGLDLTPADAVAGPTVRGLARTADATAADPDHDSAVLVTIRSTGDRTPLTCIHAVNGRILAFRNLADHLDDDQPVDAFTALGLRGSEEPLDSIPAMARRYVDELKARRPHGPYRLLGECFGGSVGLEMARLLEEQGDVVTQVVVIDGALPWEDARAVTLAGKARRALREGGPLEVVRGLVRRVTRRTQQARILRSDDAVAQADVLRQRVFEASITAFGRFTPTRVAAPILLIRATDDGRPDDGGQPDWADFTSSLTEVFVDTDHLSILQEPAVADVARLVAEHG